MTDFTIEIKINRNIYAYAMANVVQTGNDFNYILSEKLFGYLADSNYRIRLNYEYLITVLKYTNFYSFTESFQQI